GLIYYGITYFQSSIEAVLFLKYMQNTMTDAQIYDMIYVGIINSVVMAIASVMLFWKEREVQEMYQYPLGTNLKRIILLGFFYALVYVLFGGFVFKPLAGEHFQTYYGELQIPDWLLPFQVLRGFLWAALAFWTASIISANRRTAIWVITGIITIPFSSLLLPINEIMPAPIRLAHLVEVTSSMLVFGYVAGRVFTKPHKP
ncbi:MAG: hypothetical protein OEY34_02910, partial [Cyclobacteriaceae bacterium]|nr:hypothetical protein [Cyclobacteriaceae bacterium]